MSYQKIRPCPECKSTDHTDVFKYDSGWCHVECVKCNYLGPGEGSIGAAIKSHNAKAPALLLQHQLGDTPK